MQTIYKQDDTLADLKKFLFYVLKYWYVIIICLFFALGGAYMINKYSHPVYPVSLSLYVKENPGAESSAAILYANNPLLQGNPNYFNEPFLIKADPVMKDVVEKLNFHILYYKEGRLKTTEIYPRPELVIDPSEGGRLPYGQAFFLKIENGREYYLCLKGEDEEASFTEKDKYAFGDKVRLGGGEFIIKAGEGLKSNQLVGDELILQILNPESVGRSYSNRLTTSWTAEGASLLDLTLYGSSPQKEIDFLNTLARSYIEKNSQEKTENATRTIDFINEQLQQISDSLNQIETNLETFKRNNLSANISSEASGLLSRLNEMETDRGEYLLQQKYYDYILGYIRKDQTGDPVVPAAVGVSDPVLNSLVTQLVTLQLERNQVQWNSSTENPYLAGINNQIADIKENIIENVQNQSANLKINQQDIGARIGTLETELRRLPRVEREYVNIQRMYNLSEGLYLFLMQKKAEAGIAKASTTASIRVVNPAKRIGGAVSPNVTKNYVVALAAGLGLPVGVLFLLFYFNDRIRYKDDVSRLSTIPFLGSIGHNTSKTTLIVAEKPRSAVAESFRSIRSNLHFFHKTPADTNKTYLITSSVSGEGKTFCSANLAIVHAYSGKKTLIVGADLRKPGIFEDFKLNQDLGLSNYLIGQAGLEEIIQQTSIPNLALITGGIIPPNPSELLLSENMKLLMEALKSRFDILILDTPPVGLVTDALVLTPYVDHTIFLVRQNYTKETHIRAAQEMYENEKLKNVSMLYNDLKVSRYGYNYGYGYGAKNYYTD